MRRLFCFLVITLLFYGCSESTPANGTLPAPPPARTAEISGRLVRSSSGLISVVEGAVSEGSTVVSGVRVTLLGSGQSVAVGPDGQFLLKAAPGRHFLRVDPPGALVEVPAFSPEAGPPVRLSLFPDQVSLRDEDTLTMRAVGVDTLGRFTPVDPAALTWEVEADDTPRPTPDTSAFSELADQQRVLRNATVGSEPAGSYRIRVSGLGLSSQAKMHQANQGVSGSLQGRVLDGLTPVANVQVSVPGANLFVTTDAEGRYHFKSLPPLVSQVIVYDASQIRATGVAPIQSLLRTDLDLPVLASVYTQGLTLNVPDAAGLATVPFSDELLVCARTAIARFSPQGQSLGNLSTAAFSDVRVAGSDFAGTIMAADGGSTQVRVVGSKPQTLNGPENPGGVAADAGGSFYVSDLAENSIQAFNFNKARGAYEAGKKFGNQILSDPAGLAISRAGQIYVADQGANKIEVLSLDGSSLRHFAVSAPRAVALDRAGNLYVLTATRVLRYDARGSLLGSFGTFTNPLGIAVGLDGAVWVSENGQVLQFVPNLPPVLAPAPLPVPKGTSLLSDDDFAHFETRVQALMQRFEIPGGSFSLSRGGRLLIHRGYGYGTYNDSQQIPVQPDNLFRLASCSKSFAAVTLLIQLQAGMVEQDDLPFSPLGVLASFVQSPVDNQVTGISVQELLQMSAGLDTVTGLYAPQALTLGNPPPASAAVILTFILNSFQLGATPGKTYVYSDVAYLAIGRLVEAVEGSGESYGDILRKGLLLPIGAGRVRVSDTRPDGAAPGEVSYYPSSGDVGGQSVFTDTADIVSATYGGVWDGRAHDSCGGLIASTADMVRLLNSVGPDGPSGFVRPLTQETVKMMVSRPPFNQGSGGYFGMGFNVDAQGTKILNISKDGALPGTMSFMRYYPEPQLAWAIVLNSEPGPGTQVSDYAIGQFIDAVEALIQAENARGGWPESGDLFPTAE
ncbi:hypothetical protein DYH09_19035 [bacterium CPR1]|nr:hypothetical protein [bacterium CPR1]